MGAVAIPTPRGGLRGYLARPTGAGPWPGQLDRELRGDAA